MELYLIAIAFGVFVSWLYSMRNSLIWQNDFWATAAIWTTIVALCVFVFRVIKGTAFI